MPKYRIFIFDCDGVVLDSNYFKIGSLIYMIFVFTPMIPSGAFFSSNLLTIFMLNLSIFYALDKKSNIFNNRIIDKV